MSVVEFFLCFFYFLSIFFFFFFFQAEDGIRDDLVTGVQTCALPISASAGSSPPAPGCRAAPPRRRGSPTGTAPAARVRGREPVGQLPAPHPRHDHVRHQQVHPRSEERRVGKECRSRRTPHHYEKNNR